MLTFRIIPTKQLTTLCVYQKLLSEILVNLLLNVSIFCLHIFCNSIFYRYMCMSQTCWSVCGMTSVTISPKTTQVILYSPSDICLLALHDVLSLFLSNSLLILFLFLYLVFSPTKTFISLLNKAVNIARLLYRWMLKHGMSEVVRAAGFTAY